MKIVSSPAARPENTFVGEVYNPGVAAKGEKGVVRGVKLVFYPFCALGMQDLAAMGDPITPCLVQSRKLHKGKEEGDIEMFRW